MDCTIPSKLPYAERPQGLPFYKVSNMEEHDLPKKLYRTRRNGTLAIAAAYCALAIPFSVLILIGIRGRDTGNRISGVLLAVFFSLGAIYFLYEGVRDRSICLTLREEGFTYRIFPGGERDYLYSDCVSWKSVSQGKYRHPNVFIYSIRMNDGARLIVDNHMLKDGFGLRISFYDGLPEEKQ